MRRAEDLGFLLHEVLFSNDSRWLIEWSPVNKYKLRIWLNFIAWLIGAVLCGVIDHIRHSSIFLSIYLPLAAVIVVLASRTRRSRRYNFEVVEPGVVRSPLGFEVRVSHSRLEYVEGNHVVSWQATPMTGSIGRFRISERGIGGWDEPFAAEPMDDKKKREVAKAVASALVYRQLVEEGRIRRSK
jgi:hypothetical protein